MAKRKTIKLHQPEERLPEDDVPEEQNKEISTEEAVMSTFVQFCDQYSQMGETLKVLGSFISIWKKEQDDIRGRT